MPWSQATQLADGPEGQPARRGDGRGLVPRVMHLQMLYIHQRMKELVDLEEGLAEPLFCQVNEKSALTPSVSSMKQVMLFLNVNDHLHGRFRFPPAEYL